MKSIDSANWSFGRCVPVSRKVRCVRTLKVIALAGGVALTSGATPREMQSQAFEGAISIRLTNVGRNGAASQDLEYLTRGGNVRVNVSTPGGPIAILHLIDGAKTYLMMESQKAYTEVLARNIAAVNASDVKVIRSGRRESIAGHDCEHLMVETSSATGVLRTDVCATGALGGFVNPMAAVAGGLTPAWQRVTADAGFPLRVIMPDGTVALEVTKIEKRRVRDDVFRIPADFNKMDMPKRPPS